MALGSLNSGLKLKNKNVPFNANDVFDPEFCRVVTFIA